MQFFIDHHIEAGVTISGMVLDLLGALYLAYDVLGGRSGPLRSLTKFITYGLAGMLIGLTGYAIVFNIVLRFHFNILDVLGTGTTFGVGLGYAIIGGFTSGVAYMVGVDIRRRHVRMSNSMAPARWFRVAAAFGVGVLAGATYALATAIILLPPVHPYIADPRHAFILGCGLGFMSGVVFGISGGRLLQHVNPNLDEKPRPDWLGLVVGIVLGLGVAPVCGLSFWLSFGGSLAAPLVTSGLVGIIGGLCCGVALATAPIIEWFVYNLPVRRLGVAGTGLILAGFVIQSLQYWINLLDIPVH